MNNEKKKETTTFGKILKGLGIATLVVLSGVAIYDHREQIGSACRSIQKKIFTKKAMVMSSSESAKPNTNTNNYNNNPRRMNNNNIRKN